MTGRRKQAARAENPLDEAMRAFPRLGRRVTQGSADVRIPL
jgi:hypothetical protein